MHENTGGHFSAFEDRDRMKAERGRVTVRRHRIKRTCLGLAFLVLIVVGMRVAGGSGQRAYWKAAKRYLVLVSRNAATPESTKALFEIAQKIEDTRGNHSALAGLYSVTALQYLALNDTRRARGVFQVLNQRFTYEPLFDAFWAEDNLTARCKACGGKSRMRRCDACGGSGKKAALSSRLSNSSRSSKSGSKDCLACKGRGKIAANQDVLNCNICGGDGMAVSHQAVQHNLSKAVGRAKLLARLKILQGWLALQW